MNMVTVLCAVSAMPTFTGMPEFAISVAALCRMPCVPTRETPARTRIRLHPETYVFELIGIEGSKIDGQT